MCKPALNGLSVASAHLHFQEDKGNHSCGTIEVTIIEWMRICVPMLMLSIEINRFLKNEYYGLKL